MPQILVCPNPNCKKPMQVPDGSGGKQLKCPTCQKMLIFPHQGGSGGRPPDECGIHARLRRPPGGNSAAADLNSADEAE